MGIPVIHITHSKHKLEVYLRAYPDQSKETSRKDKFRSKANLYDTQAHRFWRVFSVTAD